MNTDNIKINTQSSIRLELDKIVYFDPYLINDCTHDADIIFITHDHYDHFDLKSINNIKKEDTIVVAPKSMEKEISKISFKAHIYLEPNEEIDIDSINIKTILAYNNLKPFHPKRNKWLGYIVKYHNIIYYIAGDTDKTADNVKVKCDIAFLPIGGHFTMDVKDASKLASIINPKVVIPIHYGSIIGSVEEGKHLKELLKGSDIEVIEKLKF